MIARVAQVITCASACRCFEASERTSASASRAFSSIRPVILPPSQVASRVSRIVPITISTISRPLPRTHEETPRAHEEASASGCTLRNITLHHCRTPLSATTRRRLRTTAGAPKVHRRDRSARLLLQAKSSSTARQRLGQDRSAADGSPPPQDRALGGLGIRSTVNIGPSPLSCQRAREIATPAALDPGGT
jgi:hypothetical protein